MKRSARRAALLCGVTLAATALGSTAAHADTRTDAPGCASVTEFGSVAKVVINGSTAASVRAYQGCGKTYTMTWVETDWAAAHPGYTEYAGVYDTADNAWEPGTTYGFPPTQKLWSAGVASETTQIVVGGVSWHNCDQVLGYITPTSAWYRNQNCTTS